LIRNRSGFLLVRQFARLLEQEIANSASCRHQRIEFASRRDSQPDFT